MPYRTLTEAGYTVDVATPGAVAPTADQGSLDGGEAPFVPAPLALEGIDLGNYDAVFYPGGHAPMEDLAVDAASGALIGRAITEGKPLAPVCHGVAALAPVDPALLSGRRVTGFSNAEEKLAGLADRAPFLVKDRLVALGTGFSAADPWQPHVVVDGALITGQNPASSAGVAAELLKAIGAR